MPHLCCLGRLISPWSSLLDQLPWAKVSWIQGKKTANAVVLDSSAVGRKEERRRNWSDMEIENIISETQLQLITNKLHFTSLLFPWFWQYVHKPVKQHCIFQKNRSINQSQLPVSAVAVVDTSCRRIAVVACLHCNRL